MNKFFLIAFLILLVSVKSSWSQQVVGDFDYASFYNSKTGPYLETYLSFKGDILHYVLTDDSTFVASVEVSMLFKNANEIKEYRRFKLVTAPLPDTVSVFANLIDMQKIPIPNGVYNFDLIVRDVYGGDTILPLKMEDIIVVDFPEKQIALSGIEFVDSYGFSKNSNIYMKGDMECIPYVSGKYNADQNYLNVYAELYNAAKYLGPLESFFFLFHIEKINTQKPIKGFSYFEKQKAYNNNNIYKELNIRKLPSGNYYLVMEIQDSLDNVVFSKRKHFSRETFISKAKLIDVSKVEVAGTFVDSLTIDSLTYYVKSLKPICDDNELLFIDSMLQMVDQKTIQQFFYNFWLSRNRINPGVNWLEYLNMVQIVEDKYRTSYFYGFETSRGNTLLKYGMPNEISSIKNTEDASLKEVWQYYMLADRVNVEFEFRLDTKSGEYNLEKSTLPWE
ncbi:MAG: GWxTD domain-containing protein [Salinivirgaceae bacterium]|jgi:GWxTD domain-containing protein|nr:GWxTD domain-containing protein [Salinivirgaceae bacterium]